MSKNNKVIKNYLYNTAYELLRLLAPLITTPYVSRVLGASGVGAFSYSQSIASYFVLIGAVGTTLYGQREIAYVQNNPQKRADAFWEIEIFRFTTAIICTIIFYMVFSRSEQYSIIFKILTFEVLATAIDISWFFVGIEDFKITVVRNTIIKLTGIILVFLLVKKADDVPLYTVCMTLPIFIGNLSLWYNMRKYLVKPDKGIFKRIPVRIKPILVLFIPQIAVEVYAVLDKTMIGVISDDIKQVGYYTQAQKIIKIVLMIIISLGTVMLPAMSAAFAQGKIDEIKQNIKRSFRFVFMIAFALQFGVCAVASRFVPVFFGDGYDLVVPLMIIISPILVVIGMSNVIGKQYLLPTKQQTAYTSSVCTGAVVNFALNMILIRYFDAIGASIATVLAEISVTVVQMWHVRKQLSLKEYLEPLFRYFLLGFVMFIIVYGLGRILPSGVFYLGILIVAGIIIYLLELVITKDEMLKTGFNMVRQKMKKAQV